MSKKYLWQRVEWVLIVGERKGKGVSLASSERQIVLDLHDGPERLLLDVSSKDPKTLSTEVKK